MSKDFLALRERALEDEVFHRIVEANERAAVLKDAEEEGGNVGTAGYQMLKHWLSESPGGKVLHAWKDNVGAACQTLTAQGVASLRNDVISHACKVAAAAGGILGIGSISQKEEAVLDDLGQAFVGGTAE
jgi:hypothetical protein